jgi:hypothetical protein
VNFFCFRTGRSSQIGIAESRVLDSPAQISVSPDGRTLLYTDVVAKDADLMLVEHFRW